MGDVWGHEIRLTIFGESHGAAVGVVVDGLPPGEAIDLDGVAAEMARRAPGTAPWATQRREADTVEVLSGLYNGQTTGSAVCGLIRNQNARSEDYPPLLRPGHADWTALLKYGGCADMRGGGHFSGRLTAPLVFAGALAKQVLARRGVRVYGRAAAIGGVEEALASTEEQAFAAIAQKAFPALTEDAKKAMEGAIEAAAADGDSVGGVVEVAAFGVPGGIGDPFFASFESVAASLFYAIPAVKGVSFGSGFALADMRGSGANDALRLDNGAITSDSNHNGGILGGITNGLPVTARLAFKPTPSIALPQASVNPRTLREETIMIKGRHDPCVVPRAVPVAESALALAVLECLARKWSVR